MPYGQPGNDKLKIAARHQIKELVGEVRGLTHQIENELFPGREAGPAHIPDTTKLGDQIGMAKRKLEYLSFAVKSYRRGSYLDAIGYATEAHTLVYPKES